MKYLLIVFFVFSTVKTWADENAKPVLKQKVTSIASWGAGFSTIQWSEVLKIEQAGLATTSTANYNGVLLSVQRDVYYYSWGWSLSGVLGFGGANGGSSAGYYQKQVPFTLAGLTSRLFYRASGRLSVGASAQALYKKAKWPTENGDTVESGADMNLMGMFDMSLPIFSRWDLYQGIGPVGENSAAFWRIGVVYRY